MYTAHFGLNAAPFSITPDPHYLYLSVRHREALAHLLYGVNEGPGFVLLTGEVGTGKTTLCRSLIEQLPETVDIALLLNPRLSPQELLAALFDELRISYESHFTAKDFIDRLNSYLLTAHFVGRRTVLILDEAQNLSTDVLEQVRLLTNLETSNQKLLQIILVGQPELNRLIKRNNLRQLAQRITARYHLLPLSIKDTQAYINHRLAISGAKSPLFTEAAARLVYRYSKGIPRLINIICDRALLGGYVNNENPIDTHIVRKAVQEVRGENLNRSTFGWLMGTFTTLLLVASLAWWWFNPNTFVFFQSATPPQNTFSFSNSSEATPVVEVEELTPPPETSIIPLTPAPQATKEVSLSDIFPKTNTELAFTTLFNLWEIDYQNLPGSKACERAATQGLACLLRTGTWDELKTYNRPGVIELVTKEGKQHHLVVKHIQENTVTFVVGTETYEFPISQINQYWLGQFLVLWQPPMLPIPVLKVGITNDAVIWVRKQLDKSEGISSEMLALSPRFDYALKRRLIAFQRQHKLRPDGVIGERTLLVLQTLAGRGPKLTE
jgi:general secretion pathway protein A